MRNRSFALVPDWFASPIERAGGSIWFVSIRRQVVFFAVVPPQ
jgi:hypothetical protein